MTKHDLLWPDEPTAPTPASVVIAVIDAERERLNTIQSALESCKQTISALKKHEAEILQNISAMEEALLAVTKRG
jgi:hypothetical protein